MDVPTYLLAFKWAWHRKRWARRVLYGVVFVGSALALWSGVSDGDVTVSDVLPSLLLLGALAYYIYRSRDMTVLSQRIKQMPGYGQLSSWTIKEDGYEGKQGDETNFVPWDSVFETVSTPDGILIYLQKDTFSLLPKTAFFNDADYSRVVALTVAKTKHSKVG